MNSEMRTQIMALMKAENEDYNRYVLLAEEAEQRGEKHISGMIRDIAHDEETHAKILNEILGE